MSTSFLSPGWRMPTNKNQSKQDNYSLDFTGSELINVSDLSNIPTGSSPRTVSAWFNSSYSGTAEPTIVSYGASATAQIFIIMLKGGSGADAGRLRFVGYSRDYTFTTADLRDNQWHHVAMTYNGTIIEAFLDGSSVGSFTPSTVLNTGTSFFKIGVQWSYWVGQIESVCIFDYVLSPSQVTTLWGGGTSVSNPMALPRTPIAYYPLGESAGGFVGGTGIWLIENNAIGDYVFDFDGAATSSFIEFNNSISLNNNYTFSIWFNPDVVNKLQVLAYDTTSAIKFISLESNSTSIRVRDGVNEITFTVPTILANNWYNLVLQVSAGVAKLFLNNNESSTGSLTLNSSWGIKRINGYSNQHGGDYNFNGEMSNAQIFNTALSSTDIETLYNYGSPIQTLASIPQNSNLKAWYKLDASEVFNSTTTEWEVDQAQAPYQSSSYIPGISGQYIQVNGYPALTGTSAGSWSFWYNTQSAPGSTYGGWFNGNQAQWIQPYGTPHGGFTNSAEFSILTSNGRQLTSRSSTYSRRIFIDAPKASALNTWVHVVGTYDGSNLRVYVDGEQRGASDTDGTRVFDFPATGTLTTASLQFGGDIVGSQYLYSYYSNFSVWDKKLSQSEITEIFNNGQPKSLSTHSASSNLVSWWTLENLTTGLVDTIGGYNASVVGSNSYTNEGSVSQLNGTSSGMSQASLVQSDLQTVAPYSKYALDFDGVDETILLANSPIVTGVFTISMWIKRTSLTSPESAPSQYLIQKDAIGGGRVYSTHFITATGEISFYVWTSAGAIREVTTSTVINDTEWHNVVFVNNGDTINNQVYLDGAEASYTVQDLGVSTLNSLNVQLKLGGSSFYAPANFYGSMSNTSIWNTNLTSSQVTEIYNEGLPSNLNSHSAYSNLVSWWQLGENSSFATNWICADEKGSNNGQSQNMGVDALTNGVGTTANGVSNGMGVEALIGDAPYSTANAISSNMSVLAKGTDPADIPS